MKRRDISKYKQGVAHLIGETLARITFDGEEKTKSIIQNHKDAFIAAAKLIQLTFNIESAESNGRVDSKWYRDSIATLIAGGENTLDVMEDAIQSRISSKSEAICNSDIMAKSMAADAITEMRSKIEGLEELMRENKEGEFTVRQSEGTGVHDYCLKHAK